jgi:spermidine synthase
MPFSRWRSEVAVFTDRGHALPDCQVEASNAVQRHNPVFVLYLLTLFLNAALMFIVEPMVARMILPLAGGSSTVWNTSVLFFQVSLLAGYLYAHFANAWLGTARHALVHLILVLGALLFLPIAIPSHWFLDESTNPSLTIFTALVCSIGYPFFVISAGAPLLQKWFTQVKHPAARDPYFMYGASNLGSMAGLVAYPVLLEPNLTLSQQSHFWFYGYLFLLLVTSGSVLLSLQPISGALKGGNITTAPLREDSAADEAGAGGVTLMRRWRWICWSFVPSSLLLGVTSYITTDIVSAPLFWVLPLAIYLLTYVLAFARDSWATHLFLVRRQAFLLLVAAFTVIVHATSPVWLILPIHLISFLVTALVCHGQLAKDRPAPSRLTEFYLWISLGGALGGLFNAIAPLLFNSVLEYPLVLAAAAFLRPYVSEKSDKASSHWADLLLPGLLCIAIVSLIYAATIVGSISPLNAHLLAFGVAGVICLLFAYRPVRFGLGMLAILISSLMSPHPFGRTLYAARSFFGVYRAIDEVEAKRHVLFQGTTAHGAQNLAARLQPTGYYHRTGPAGQVLRVLAQTRPTGNVAVVGLGTGALACHGTASQHFTFFEIDPLVEKIARSANLFTYLRDCPTQIDVMIGDARLSLAKQPHRQFDLLVLDAFSSDAIPTHLLTLEAIELYYSKIAQDGLVLVHVSNRYMELAPILDRLAHRLNLVALIRNDFHSTVEEQEEGKSASRWIVMASQREPLEPFLADRRWHHLDGSLGGDLWTDDFTDVLKIIHWR